MKDTFQLIILYYILKYWKPTIISLLILSIGLSVYISSKSTINCNKTNEDLVCVYKIK